MGGGGRGGGGVIEAAPGKVPAGSAGTGAPGGSLAANCALFNNGLAGATVAARPNFPFLFKDRDRDKFRLLGNWFPNERLSLTFLVEDSKDKYSAPTGDSGLHSAGMRMYSLDAAYVLSDAWRLSAYWSRGEQTTKAGHSSDYDATLKDTADSIGLGLNGKPSGRVQGGADLTYLNDVLKYKQDPDPAITANNRIYLNAVGGLPDVTYRLLRLKFFGEYALDRASYLRVDLIHQRTLFDEWTYNYNNTPFFYSDNTTLSAKQNQSVTFLGASYIYRFK